MSEGIGLSLSGGGYRAALFHLGAFWWFCEHGRLKSIDRISSVSGGSITSAMVGLKWKKITDVGSYQHEVVRPIRKLTSKSIDRGSIIRGLFLSGSAARQISKEYQKTLFGSATLQDLPNKTRFIINATNVGTGKLWRFSKPYMGDYLVGRISNPKTSLADAVTASSAFPPMLSPFRLDVVPEIFDELGDLHSAELQAGITLTDGGVYDNLGFETVGKRCRTVLVSDAGGSLQTQVDPTRNWAGHTARVINIIHGQVASQRKREFISDLSSGHKNGAYWGVASKVANYGLENSFDVPVHRTRDLSEMPTRLKKTDNILQERMINWGYAVCDAALRRHVFPSLSKPKSLPYADRGI